MALGIAVAPLEVALFCGAYLLALGIVVIGATVGVVGDGVPGFAGAAVVVPDVAALFVVVCAHATLPAIAVSASANAAFLRSYLMNATPVPVSGNVRAATAFREFHFSPRSCTDQRRHLLGHEMKRARGGNPEIPELAVGGRVADAFRA